MKISEINFEEKRLPAALNIHTARLACTFAHDTVGAYDLNTHDMETLSILVALEAVERQDNAPGDFYPCAFVEQAAVRFNETDNEPTLEDLFEAGQRESDAIAG